MSITLDELEFIWTPNSYFGHPGRPGLKGGSLPRGTATTTFRVPNYSKEKLKKALAKFGLSEPREIYDNLSSVYPELKEKYKKVAEKMKERYGEKWWDEWDHDEEYREYLNYKQKRYEELQNKVLSELGVQLDYEAHWMEQETYNRIHKAAEEGKLNAGFFNRDEIFSIDNIATLYKQKSFNWETGEFKLERHDYNSDREYIEESDEYYLHDEDYNAIFTTKMTKVSVKEIQSWMTTLGIRQHFPPITSSERRSLEEYGLVSAVNQQLRKGESSKTATNITNAINKNYTPALEVYRGLRGDFAQQITKMKEGDTLTDKGFMSTSDYIGGETAGAAKFGSIILKIKTKEGFGKAIDMSPYVRDFRFLTESEILLQRNTTIKFTGKISDAKTLENNTVTIYEFEEV